MSEDPSTLTRLDELLAAIKGCPDSRRASNEWKQVYKLLQQTHLPGVTGVVGMRDVAGLERLVAQLRTPTVTAEPAGPIAAEELRKAMQAFRKRVEFTVLDEESKLGRGPLSKSHQNVSAAIVPPVEWPEGVWQELVRQGRLRYVGHGFYELPKH